MALKQGDFIEIEYTGKLESGEVFDTTSKKAAQDAGIFDENTEYGPAIIVVGGQQLLRGLDEQLVGKEIGNNYTLNLTREQGFGKKDAKLLKLISTAKFRKQGMNPIPGLRVNFDGHIGTIRTVTGGRTIVDFNHPLAGHELIYEVKLLRKIIKTEEQLKAMVKVELYDDKAKIELKEGKAKVKLTKEIPQEILDKFIQKAKEKIPDLRGLEIAK